MARDFIERMAASCGGCRRLALLLLVNMGVALLVLTVTLAGWLAGVSTEWLGLWLSMPADLRVLATRPWTPITYMVTHYSVLHLLFNMLWLYWFGRILAVGGREREILWLYIGGGLAGAILFVAGAYTLGHGAALGGWLCGASASVLALTAASAIIFPDFRLRLLLIGEVKLKWIALVTILLTCLGFGGGNSGAQMAHIGGALFGICAGMAMKRGFSFDALRHRRPRPHPTAGIRPRQPSREGAAAAAEAASGRLCDASRLDELLDRIRVSGYESLSSSERRELDAISRRIHK